MELSAEEFPLTVDDMPIMPSSTRSLEELIKEDGEEVPDCEEGILQGVLRKHGHFPKDTENAEVIRDDKEGAVAYCSQMTAPHRSTKKTLSKALSLNSASF
jgi:hypothetical protein